MRDAFKVTLKAMDSIPFATLAMRVYIAGGEDYNVEKQLKADLHNVLLFLRENALSWWRKPCRVETAARLRTSYTFCSVLKVD
jgi:hypothetical protein